MKNIWMFNHYATKPDGPKPRSYDLGKQLIKKGHKITIFASSFSHYKLKEEYIFGKEKSKTENCEGINFIWLKTFPYKKNNWQRILNMVSFAWRAFAAGIKAKEKPDVIIGTSVHPFAALSAYFASRVKKSRFFFEITDLWPQMLIDNAGISKNNPFVLFLRALEKFLFKKAEKIIIIPPNIKDYIMKRGVPEQKIVSIPNGIDLSFYNSVKKYDGGGLGPIVFMYSGIFARYAGLETILKTARILQSRKNKKIKFILLGDGAEKPNLVRLAEELDLKNLDFYDMVPRNETLKIYEQADVFICIIKDIISSVGVSSKKLNDYMAFGRPIIFAVNSPKNPVEEAGAGITVLPENPEALAGAAEKMAEFSPEERVDMAKNAREYAGKFLDIRLLADKFEKLL